MARDQIDSYYYLISVAPPRLYLQEISVWCPNLPIFLQTFCGKARFSLSPPLTWWLVMASASRKQEQHQQLSRFSLGRRMEDGEEGVIFLGPRSEVNSLRLSRTWKRNTVWNTPTYVNKIILLLRKTSICLRSNTRKVSTIIFSMFGGTSVDPDFRTFSLAGFSFCRVHLGEGGGRAIKEGDFKFMGIGGERNSRSNFTGKMSVVVESGLDWPVTARWFLMVHHLLMNFGDVFLL